ncbi:MarR family winged helix-turn-helix transcriptional regulator [Streptococcus loxodontisalivarius]|uniref:DNA-binding MarR family transcriptional regulator n=1 Tax=Streptococcus loxodontisalivarius TaxID=1349415 RepID=A0ABS2PUC0_9STRE|nr:MarR family winged helix-turn-helix transcriptional regulator [Streptococcus loxodontisalivarius]MBM7643647.1 DNA-binding MarR family transcriptional regulator [Streptococcus loxodontisalivarius]
MYQKTKSYIRIFDQQMSFYENYARKKGMNGKALQILLWINGSAQTGISQNKIAQATHSTKQVVHAIIKNWLDKGYLELRANPDDKRHKLIFLTAEGSQFADATLQPLEALEEKAMAILTDEEQAQLIDLSRRYYQVLEKGLE